MMRSFPLICVRCMTRREFGSWRRWPHATPIRSAEGRLAGGWAQSDRHNGRDWHRPFEHGGTRAAPSFVRRLAKATQKRDARQYAVRLTPRGRELVKLGGRAARQADETLLSRMPRELRVPFLEALKLLTKTDAGAEGAKEPPAKTP